MATLTNAQMQAVITAGGVVMWPPGPGAAEISVIGNLPSDAAIAAFFAGPTSADSVRAEGAVTTPAALAAIATIAAPGAGDYEIHVLLTLSGTLAAADANNLSLSHGSTVVSNLEVPATAAVPVLHSFPRVTVAAGEAISVNAIGLATTGAVYTAEIVATRMS